MLNFLGSNFRNCDGIRRREMLRIGSFAIGSTAAFTMSDILRAESQSPSQQRSPHKSVINIFLGGGPPHQDMWDIKTEAPREIRGEFDPIATNVPGIEICEVFHRLAKHMDKCVVIRSVVGSSGEHDGYQCLSGWHRRDSSSIGGRPSIGAVAAKLRGPVDPAIPPFVALAAKTQHVPWSEPGGTGFLGAACQSFRPQGEGMNDLQLNGIDVGRFNDRKTLLKGLDQLKRDVDATGMLAGMDSFSQAAFGVLTSSRLLEALDVSREDPRVRERYGDGKPYKYQYDGAPTCNDQVLMARRLVEVGVRCVTLTFGRWDSHGQNFDLVRDHGGKLDQAVSALLEDLEERNLLSDVTVAVWGEFGRTPRINPQAGRDHWPQVSCALLAGGGMRTGQVIGSTNRLGEFAKDRPIHVQQVVGQIYRNLGIDPAATTIADPTGRPQYLIENRDPILELM